MRIRIVRPAGRIFYPDSDKELRELAKEWQALASPGTEIDIVRVAKGVATIESDYDVEMATPFVIQEVERAEKDGFDAVMIYCMSDPGLQGAREATRMAVVGMGQACYLTALALGDRFSIVSPGGVDDGHHRRILRKYGLADHLASVRYIGLRVRELRKDLRILKEAFQRAAAEAVEKDGAQVIIPGCGRIYGITDEVQRELGVPVLDPLATGIRFTEMVVALGLSHSKRAFMSPPATQREI